MITGHGYQMNMSLKGTVPAKVIFNVSVDVEHGSIVWSRSNGKMSPTAVMKEDGSLMIMDVQLEDAGQYSCTAKNKSGEVTSEVFEVILEGETYNFYSHTLEHAVAKALPSALYLYNAPCISSTTNHGDGPCESDHSCQQHLGPQLLCCWVWHNCLSVGGEA